MLNPPISLSSAIAIPFIYCSVFSSGLSWCNSDCSLFWGRSRWAHLLRSTGSTYRPQNGLAYIVLRGDSFCLAIASYWAGLDCNVDGSYRANLLLSLCRSGSLYAGGFAWQNGIMRELYSVRCLPLAVLRPRGWGNSPLCMASQRFISSVLFPLPELTMLLMPDSWTIG